MGAKSVSSVYVSLRVNKVVCNTRPLDLGELCTVHHDPIPYLTA